MLLALDLEDRYTVPHYVKTAARGFKDDLAHQVATHLPQILELPGESRDARGIGPFLVEVTDIADAVATVIGPHVRVDGAPGTSLPGHGAQTWHYERAAEAQASTARRWLLGVATCVVLLVAVIAWLLLGGLAADAERVDADRLALMHAPEALATAVLAFALVFCSRNYRSHKCAQMRYQERTTGINTYVLLGASIPEGVEGRAEILSELAKLVLGRDENEMSSASSGSGALPAQRSA